MYRAYLFVIALQLVAGELDIDEAVAAIVDWRGPVSDPGGRLLE